MSVQAQTSSERFLEIRTLHVVSGSGEGVDFRSVRCPSRGRSVALEDCLACPDSAGALPAAAGRMDQVACRGAPALGWGAVAAPGAVPPDLRPVSAVMTSQVVAVRPDVSLEALAGLLLDRGFGGAPVVDEEGRPVGVVSKTDLMRERQMAGDTAEVVAPGWQPGRDRFRAEVGRGFHAVTATAVVADVMTPAAYTLSEEAPVAEAAALMAFEGIHRVPVVADDGRVAGIVTSLDVLRFVAQEAGYLSSARMRREGTSGAASGGRDPAAGRG